MGLSPLRVRVIIIMSCIECVAVNINVTVQPMFIDMNPVKC